MKKLLLLLPILLLAGCSQDSIVEKQVIKETILISNINIKENCMDILRKSPRNYDIELIDDADNNCSNLGCISLFVDFYGKLNKTDNHDPNNYCQGLEDIYNFVISSKSI